MAGMRMNLSNLFQFIAYISPFLLAFTFILIGFLNNEPVKALVYIGSVCLTTFLVGLLQQRIGSESINERSNLCDLWDIPGIGNAFNSPSLSTFFLSFSLLYIVLPMVLSGHMNYSIMTLLLILFVSDVATKLMNKCTTWMGVVLGSILGLLLSSVIILLVYNTFPELLFFGNIMSNNVSCSKPSKQQFKCSVYRNGQLLKQI